jgi:hypothetical protein
VKVTIALEVEVPEDWDPSSLYWQEEMLLLASTETVTLTGSVMLPDAFRLRCPVNRYRFIDQAEFPVFEGPQAEMDMR